jgi:ATP-dependent DNA helicase RecG
MAQFLDTSIEYLKGVGPKRADLLKKELHIFTFKDLILFFPFRYIDRSRFYKIAEIRGEMPQVQLKGKVIAVKTIGEARKKRMVAVFSDGTGEIELVWFKGIKFLKHSITVGKELIVFGKPTLFNGKYNIAHPETEPIEKEIEFEKIGLQPVYSSTEKLNNSGLSSRNIWKLQRTLCEQISKMIPETLSQQILDDNKLIGREEAIKQLHVPSDVNLLKKALFRLKFEELFFLQLKLLRLKINQQKSLVGLNFNKVGNYFNDFYNHQLEFELTSSQKRVIKEIRKDCGTGLQMNRLLQGDVGSGKTIVSFMSMLMAIDNGFQACMMAPTEILAQQHYESISQQLNQLGLNAGLLTGSTKQSERKELFEKLENGEIHILIGTHALIEDNVKFKQLGLVVIDEQHKFGVAQRAKLWNKNDTAPHILIMTATPIPRTLAMTVYGDLDVSKIDEMPPGRKPIKTVHYFDSQRLKLFGFLEKEIAKGRQIYIVYPLIEESEN